jgi:hypothetical protein
MKYLFLIAILLIGGRYVSAQNCDTVFLANELQADNFLAQDSVLENDSTNEILLLTDQMENAIVHQDSAIRQLMMDKYLGIARGQLEISGFRVQVYSSNQQQFAKNESILLQQALEQKLSHPVYVISEPPFWKVRIGNFRTRDEANQYKESLLDLFPELQSSMYVVPDKVIVLN